MDGRELKAWRERENLTQGAAAARLGISRPTIARYESGSHPIPDELAAKISAPAAAAGQIGEKAADLRRAPKTELTPELAAVGVKRASQIDMGDRRPATSKEEIPHQGDPRRFVAPPGVDGCIAEKDWKWPRLDQIPRGVWRKILTKQKTLSNGMVITMIEYRSNGVGNATMELLGATLGKGPLPGLEGMAPGATYHPANFRVSFDDNLKAGDTKTAAARKALETAENK